MSGQQAPRPHESPKPRLPWRGLAGLTPDELTMIDDPIAERDRLARLSPLQVLEEIEDRVLRTLLTRWQPVDPAVRLLVTWDRVALIHIAVQAMRLATERDQALKWQLVEDQRERIRDLELRLHTARRLWREQRGRAA